jgi:hypothetical protein
VKRPFAQARYPTNISPRHPVEHLDRRAVTMPALRKVLATCKQVDYPLSAMNFAEFTAANSKIGPGFVLIACLSVGLLSGCGAGWQPDPRDAPKSPARSGIEGSGLTGPGDSTTNL